MSPFTKIARIAVLSLISLLLSGFAAFAQVTPTHLEWSYNDPSSQTVSFTATGDWTVMVIGDFGAAPTSGRGNGGISIWPNNSNPNYTERIGGVIILGNGIYYNVVLTQAARPEGPARDTEIANTRVDLPGNWIITRTYTSESGDYYDDVVFYNGLGYPEQIVKVGASPSGGHNIVTPVVYDHKMRDDAMSYLPYVSSASTLAEEPVAGALAAQRQWYSFSGPSGESQYAFSEKEYDGLGRVSATYKPGANHSRLSSSGNRPVSVEYDCNTANEVRNLTVDSAGNLVISGYRPAGAFHKITTTDEDGQVTVEFKDPQDNVRLVRRGTPGDWSDTYYAYDAIGNLAWVVSPEGSALLANGTWNSPAASDVNTSLAAKYCYIYTSDAHGRQMSAKVPGRAVEYFVYDNYGRVQRSQDGLLRSQGLWMYYFYDNVERLVAKGAHALTVTPPSLSSCNNAISYTYGTYTGLTGVGFEAVSDIVASSEVNLSHPTALKTSETLAVIDSTGVTGYLTRAFYYDSKDRVVQIVEKDPDGRISRYSTRYDFVGNPVAVSEKHGTDELRTYRTYDRRGRLQRDSLVVNGTTVTRDTYAYDALGRPSGAALAAGSSNTLNRTNSYDIQGRVTSMEVKKGLESLFGYSIFFETAPNGYRRYSGDISSMSWRHGMESGTPLYFQYDNHDRLVSSIGYADQRYTEQDISYDRNGNVLSLKRYGSNATTPVAQPTYSYDGNRRTGYTYDVNGNVTSDGSGISRSYSSLTGRLSTVNIGNSARVSYTRLSDGTKIKAVKEDWNGACQSGLAYEGSFVYSLDGNGNRTLESIAFDEGRILKSGSLFVADYHIKDHLGSVRAVVRNGNIIEEDDYYPYGAKMAKPDLISQTSPVPNRYLFSSKEDQAVAFGSYGLDFGARDYAHDGLTWFEPDPLASKYYHLSPYAYCAGNPLKFVDPDGKEYEVIIRAKYIKIEAKIYALQDQDGISIKSAQKAATFWNSRTNDTYDGKQIHYNIKVIGVSSLENFKKRNNTYEVKPVVLSSKDNQEVSGKTTNKQNVTISKSYAITKPDGTDSSTGAHEVGHMLGMDHDEEGIMTKSQDRNRTSKVTEKNISDMMSCDKGRRGFISKIFELFSNKDE